MPNYSLVLDTKFKPFSYQEMLAPVMAATQAHQALEAEYGDLATKASVWERMANEQTDPEAYRMYKAYSEDLENMANQLARSGLDPKSRSNMLNMKSRYSSEILPIEAAYKRREELAAEQRKAIAANPTLMYQRYANQMSLDDFIKNPSLDYGAQYSGALLTQQVAQAAGNLAKEINTPDGRRKIRKLLTDSGQWLPYQYEAVLQRGFTREDVDKAIRGDADANPILTGIVDGVLQSSGIQGWRDISTWNKARYFANQGLYSAIGTTEFSNITDSYGSQLALLRAKTDKPKGGGTIDPGKGRFPLNFRDLGLNNSKKGKTDKHIQAVFTKENSSASRALNSAIAKLLTTWNHSDEGEIPYIANEFLAKTSPYTFNYSYKTSSGLGDSPISNRKTHNVIGSFFGPDGKLLDKESYNEIFNSTMFPDKEILDYDKELKGLAQYLGVPVSLLPDNFDDINTAIKNVEAGKGSGIASALDLMYSEEDVNNAVRRIISRTTVDGDKLTVKEITGYNDDGTYQLGDRVKIKDIFDEEKGKVKKPTSFSMTSLQGKPHIIMQSGDKVYNVPLSDLGSIAKDLSINTNTLKEAQDIINEIEEEYGEGAYNLALSLIEQGAIPKDASEELKELMIKVAKNEATLKNAGAGNISQANIALLGRYKVDPFNTSSQTGDYEPYSYDIE